MMKGESKIFHESASPIEAHKEEEEWAVKKNLRAINERGQQLTKYAEEARLRYKNSQEEHKVLLNLSHRYVNETLGSAMIEENEKERELEISRLKEEQTLQEEYDTKIMELTSDYRAKLKDLDSSYMSKRQEIDSEKF